MLKFCLNIFQTVLLIYTDHWKFLIILIYLKSRDPVWLKYYFVFMMCLFTSFCICCVHKNISHFCFGKIPVLYNFVSCFFSLLYGMNFPTSLVFENTILIAPASWVIKSSLFNHCSSVGLVEFSWKFAIRIKTKPKKKDNISANILWIYMFVFISGIFLGAICIWNSDLIC